ncbi:MAG TPA: ExbD/TolR family protein [Vicinamibacterales bacterium]|nr:ExbD/TolR family protein [Vicinamibacterales bacterium]
MPKVHQNGHGVNARRGRGNRVSTSLAEINVIPLVDVMLVLLIIFMVAAPMMTQGMQVNLPQARRATPVTAEPIYITVPANFAAERRVQIGNETIRVDILAERAKQSLLGRDEKSLFVRADGSVAYRDLVFVVDRLKEGGIEKVGLITVPVGAK